MIQLGANANEARVYRTQAAPLLICDNLVNALKLLAKQRKNGDNPINSKVPGLYEKSRKGIMDGLKNFIEEDNPQIAYPGDKTVVQRCLSRDCNPRRR